MEGERDIAYKLNKNIDRQSAINMNESYRIYLDACCLNRPFDDQTQPRIALETQAILIILNQCESGQWKLITSISLETELAQTPDLERLKNVKSILRIAKIKVVNSSFIESRAQTLAQLGFSSYDAAHIASAELSKADIFLSTDDRLIRKGQRHIEALNVAVDNPTNWLITSTQIEEKDGD